LFPLCAYAKTLGLRENIGNRTKWIRIDDANCAYFVPTKFNAELQPAEKIWRPRRDLNPCYRRESPIRSRSNYKAAVALQCPVRNG